ncbi:PilW family protein [Legionella brunensis]|uniref:Tfp pilus assembly protein PilW n=1 Tax=Legionella brunensis TaxID=29422 RepID=A0A0W0SDT1_9GAMM|nr:prepilin-type N-terminal cleavage/methylation domain-containing protein [Legionella brunensis]KTC81543.1 hypothetical protein Lbru_2063 [Legionella brunensis]
MGKNNGLSLVEMMVTLFLGTLLLTALIEHYLSAKRQYDNTHALLEKTFELEWALDLIRNSVRSAGFTPCINLNRLESIDGHHKRRLWAIEINAGKPQALRINRMNEYFNSIIKFTADEFIISKENSYQANEAILIADCYHAEVQEISSARQSGNSIIIKLKKPLFFDYLKPAYVGKWTQEEFFIKENKRGERALYYRRNHAEELTSTVNGFSVQEQSSQGLTVLQILLQLTDHETARIETMVRAS